MISAVIIHNGNSDQSSWQQQVMKCCRQLEVLTFSFQDFDPSQAFDEKIPQLIFIEIDNEFSYYSTILERLKNSTSETILVASKKDFVFDFIKYRISGYLLKPLNPNFVRSTIQFALERIESRRKKVPDDVIHKEPDLIGIPTVDGYQFLSVNEIVRCESYRKCTRIIVQKGTDIISSYNIGEFMKVLSKYGFYSPHQSHIVNLYKVKRYLKEGTIIMHNNSHVPVARRRRNDFLNQIPHL